jgi:putative transposase
MSCCNSSDDWRENTDPDSVRENVDFGALKTESLHRYRFATREQARQVVFEYIEVFYNCIWRHAKIGNQIPADFANQLYAGKKQSAA